MSRGACYIVKVQKPINGNTNMKIEMHTNSSLKRRPKTQRLHQYMIERAAFERVPFAFDVADLEQYYDAGIRNFFGVNISQSGALTEDLQQREFFQKYCATLRSPETVAN